MNKSPSQNPSQPKKADKPKPGSMKRREKKNQKALRAFQSGSSLDSRPINAPVAITQKRTTGNPNVVRESKTGDVTVTHREFIQDIAGSVAFANNIVSVNPGLSSSFPWLSQLAGLYESYLFLKLEFEFQTMSATTTTGTVMAAIDYDASDPAPTTKQQLATYQGFVRSSPWESFDQLSSKENLSKRKSYYVRSAPLAANQDIKLYDVGNLYLSTQGQATADAVGELYVCYTVKLMTPQIGDIAVGLSKSAKYNLNAGGFGPFAGSNAPLISAGSGAGGLVSLTATAPYNALLVLQAVITAGTPAVSTATSTATIQSPVTTISGQNLTYVAQIAWLPGQVVNLSVTGGAWTGTDVSVGQFNSLVLP